MEPIFEAVLHSETVITRLLKKSPELSALRVVQDHLVETIPHWLYVGDTPLHLAAAALRVKAAKLLLASGADANAQNRRGATPLHYVCDPRPESGDLGSTAAQTLSCSWFNTERNFNKSIVAVRLPFIARCVRAVQQPFDKC
jgi:hypothetical protein